MTLIWRIKISFLGGEGVKHFYKLFLVWYIIRTKTSVTIFFLVLLPPPPLITAIFRKTIYIYSFFMFIFSVDWKYFNKRGFKKKFNGKGSKAEILNCQKRKLNIYVLAKRFILFFSIQFDSFTLEMFQTFIFSLYNIFGNRAKIRYLLNHGFERYYVSLNGNSIL